MGTVSCRNGLCMNGLRSSRMVTQALSMRKEVDTHPCPLWMQTEQVCDMICRTNRWLFMKWRINCKLVLVQPMILSTTGLSSIKSVHDGTQSNSQNCTKRNVWTSSNGTEGDHFLEWNIEGDETWIHHFEPESKCQSMEWKHPQLPTKQKSETHPTTENLMLTDFGTHKVYYWTIITRGWFFSEHCLLQWDAV